MPQPIDLSDEQRTFRDVVRRFAQERIAPGAGKRDERAEFDWDAFHALVELDLPALGIPAEYGGTGADTVTQAIAIEEVARACASTSLALLISKLGMLPVMNFGSEELKQTYLPRIATGAIQASYALSEPDAGSDVASMTTRAERDGDGWVLNGTKCWITNAGISDVYVVFARTSPDRHHGICAFVVEADWGVRVAKLEHKLGIRSSPTGVITLDDVHVPASNLIGQEGQGFFIAMHTLDRSRPTIGAQAVGIADGALAQAAEYMQERRTFGKPIAEHQGLQFIVADMAMKIEAARLLVYRACAAADSNDAELSKLGAMAKAFASDVAMEVTTNAVQLFGGYGYTEEFPVARMMRDAKITQIYEGTNQIQRIVIAKRVLR